MADEKYSFKDHTIDKTDFQNATDLDGIEIVGTCFYREAVFGETGDPTVKIFPAGMTGVTFRRCNLDNVVIPPGNTVITTGPGACCHRRIRCQNDLEDWVVDATGKPIEPIAIKLFNELGLSTDPKDIPATPLDKPVTVTD